MKLGLSGYVARAFSTSPLTPLILIAALAFGLLGLVVMPREEEPQISVPMVDILVRADGLKAVDAVELVTKPLEDIVKAIDDVEHVYSWSHDDTVVVTARFQVGHDEDLAILRVHETLAAHMSEIPLGIPEPLIMGRGINDVAILVLTLSPADANAAERWQDNALYTLAEELQHELIKVKDVGLTYITGGRPDQIRIEPDPERMSLYGVTLNQLVDKVQNANRAFAAGNLRAAGNSLPVVAGQTLQGVGDIGLLLLTTIDGRPVYLKDVANVAVGGRPDEQRAWHLLPDNMGGLARRPAVSLAIAKRKGANAVAIAEQVLERLEMVRGRLVPDDVSVTVARDYGETAAEKADELIGELISATVVIVILLTIVLGWRPGLVVAVVIPATVLLTFFASWALGFTINRVSMFALVFSIGILVDDAIVMVENIIRHWQMKRKAGRPAVEVAVEAVEEVGNPTIVATFTIIVALLPMLFVSGLMGPYMSPIPVNASVAMLFSLLMALVVTPWMLLKLRRRTGMGGHGDDESESGGLLGRMFLFAARPLLKGRARSGVFLALVTVATLAAMALFYTKDVVVKLLPFDNKSELQVVVDLPEGSSLEATERTLQAAADRLAQLPELTSIQAYVGTAAPFNFNGLVRHSYLRNQPEQGELQVNLVHKDERERTSHEVALEVRARLKDLAVPAGTTVKVVEVPPGPPVIATLLAEVYGPDPDSRRAAAAQLKQAFAAVDFVVDIDDSAGQPAERLRISIDQEQLEFHRVDEEALYDTLAALLHGVKVGYSHRGGGANPIEIALRLPKADLALNERLLATPVPNRFGEIVELGELVSLSRERASHPIYRRDGRFAEMVTAELAGRFEAPIYGMLAVEDAVATQDWGTDTPPDFAYAGQPDDESQVSFLWDGEWEITYITFRDMGGAFILALVGIYVLVVMQFQSFKLPLLILVPVPLTLIGIILGHLALGAAFTATSMIGFIALAGIIVRNSILLVDFIRARLAQGLALRQCLLDAGAVRFKPIFLTALAAMTSASFILPDPIFNGLAISLLFGMASSTILTVLVIPAIYIILRDDGRALA